MPGFTWRDPMTGAIFQTMDPSATPPTGYVPTPEPDGALMRDQKEYESGYSGDRHAGGGNPEDIPPNNKFRPPGQ